MLFIAALASSVVLSTPTLLPAKQPLLLGDGQHEAKHLVEHFRPEPPSRDRHRRVVGRGFVQRHAEKRPQTEAVGTSPGDAALAVDALEVADQQHAEVHARRHRYREPLLARNTAGNGPRSSGRPPQPFTGGMYDLYATREELNIRRRGVRPQGKPNNLIVVTPDEQGGLRNLQVNGQEMIQSSSRNDED